jgi:glycosyltransferase involved in cell wall biosynthesis
MEPLISVILPIYNIKSYLEKCMESLFAQTYKHLEIIMVDDGSTDGSEKLCDEYLAKDNRVRVFHKKNGGLSDARNYGIERSDGEYITCVDPDDFVDKDYVEYLYHLLNKFGCKMSICQHRVVFESGKIEEKGFSGAEVLSNKRCIERMLYHDVVDTSAWAKLYHKSLFDTVQYPVGKLFEDIATTYKLMLQCDKIAVGYQSKYNYIIRSNSIVNAKFNPKKLDLLEMTDNMGKEVLTVYPDLEKAVLRRRVYARFSTLNQMSGVKGLEEKRQEIIDFIMKYKGVVITDSKTPKRDIAAIKLLSLGYPVYSFLWKLYNVWKA